MDPPKHRSRRLAAVGLALLGLSACRQPHTAQETLQAFLEAVQSEDLETLFCLSAGAAAAPELGGDEAERRGNFEIWARAQYDRYLEGRDEGWIDLDGEGIPLVKLFSLGRGAFYRHDGRQAVGPDSLLLRTTVRFGYPQVDLSRLSPGTTFYLSGVPAGRVHAVRVPSRPREVRVEVMDTVAVDWTLVETEPSGGCAGGWAVASAVTVEGSATSTEVTWVF